MLCVGYFRVLPGYLVTDLSIDVSVNAYLSLSVK